MADDKTPSQDEQDETTQPAEAAADEATEAVAAPVEEEAAAEAPAEEPVAEPVAEAPAEEEPAAEAPAEVAEEAEEPAAAAEEPAAAAEEPAAAAEEPAAAAEEPAAAAEEPAAAAEEPAAEAADAPAPAAAAPGSDDEGETPRVKPAIPGADLEVDIVPEGMDPLARAEAEAEQAAAAAAAEAEEIDDRPVAATIDLAASARYTATGKRKTAIARVILKPGNGAYLINGKDLDDFFPRATLQRNIRQPLEAVGYESRMDVLATMTGGGVSSQAGALRHGISRALLEADPNLRGELKRRGFLTRDSRAKERKKAGLKKARKKPQFSKR
jgi:small subunit ribosomal protein S9